MSEHNLLRVLEIGTEGAAGYAGKLFSRWGAEVVRVDTGSSLAVPTRLARATDLYLHAGKARIAVNLENTGSLEVLRRLADHCDVILVDGAAPALDEIGFETLGGARSQVRVAITPFGLTGPHRDWQGASNVLLAMGGQTYLMGDEDRAPLTMPGRYLAYQAGQFAYTAAVACLRNHAKADDPLPTDNLDVSQYEVAQTLHQFTNVMWTFGGNVRSRHGNNFGVIHPITMYPCRDGWFAVNADPTFWDTFTVMLNRPELAADPRFNSVAARVENAEALDAIVAEELGPKSRAELMELGQVKCRMPTGVLSTLRELLDDPHLTARDFWQTLDAGDLQLKTPGSPFRFVGEAMPSPGTPRPPVDATEWLAATAGERGHA
jgi:crotonobetainyl-CoA:carnitine CoA-transferase CaiB-like acyl-CoA transferase